MSSRRLEESERECDQMIQRSEGIGCLTVEDAALAFTTNADALINDWKSVIPSSGLMTHVVSAKQYCGFIRSDCFGIFDGTTAKRMDHIKEKGGGCNHRRIPSTFWRAPRG